MRRIAPDVERLMWLVAEERDPRAIADFEDRFPDLKLELAKHIAMVSTLKGAKRKMPPHEMPRFIPRNATPRPMFNRSTYVAFAFVLAAVAFGTYAATSYFFSPPPKPPPVSPVNLGDPKLPGDKDQSAPKDMAPMYPLPAPDNPGPRHPDQPTGLAADDPLLKPITLKVDRAPLVAAIAMVCKQAGLSYQLAPGMTEQEVTLDYPGVPAKEVLADLGQKYGFTAMPQEKGTILIIPVRPDGSPPGPASTDTGGEHRKGGWPAPIKDGATGQ